MSRTIETTRARRVTRKIRRAQDDAAAAQFQTYAAAHNARQTDRTDS